MVQVTSRLLVSLTRLTEVQILFLLYWLRPLLVWNVFLRAAGLEAARCFYRCEYGFIIIIIYCYGYY